jgi:5,10-methenyltetrahydrofolate synthetase
VTLSAELAEWRKEERERLLARRAAVPAEDRRAWSEAITRHLEAGFGLLSNMAVGFCWPHAGEYDARFFIHTLRQAGARAALPVVVRKAAPLQFRAWWPGAPMKVGVLAIPFPVDTPLLLPDAVLVPPVGFTARGERLGYGGGFFDRTLESLQPQPLKIAVAFELCRIPTIHAQAHDIPMDFVVTEAGIHAVEDPMLRRIEASEAAAIAASLARARGLPRPPAAHRPAGH